MEPQFHVFVSSQASGAIDFTFDFEFIVFSILPSSIFLCLALVRMVTHWNRPIVIQRNALQWSKLVLLVCHTVLQLVNVILWSRIGSLSEPLAMSSAIVSLVASLVSCPVSWLEHGRSLAPSATNSLFYSVTFVLGIFHVRSLFLQNTPLSLCYITAVATAAKGAIAVLESLDKRNSAAQYDSGHSPEDYSGLWNRALYLWLNPLLWSGYKTPIQLQDLYLLKQDLYSETLEQQFMELNHKSVNDKDINLAISIIRALGWQLIYPCLPRCLLIGFTFGQPLLIGAILSYLEDKDDSTWSIGSDAFLIAGTLFLYLGISICSSLSQYLQRSVITKVRAILVSLIYRKVLLVRSDKIDNSAITLMSTDVVRVTAGMRSLHQVWAELAEVAIAIYLLQRQLGIGSLGPVSIAALCFFVTLGINKLTMPRQNVWMESMQKRINATVAWLGTWKGLRMMGLSEDRAQYIQALRTSEIRSANGFRIIMAATFCIAFAPIYLSPVASFGIFLAKGRGDGTKDTLDIGKAFTSLSLLVLLTEPLSSLFQYFPTFLGAVNCLQRIQSFLRTEIHTDPRSTIQQDTHLGDEMDSTKTEKTAHVSTCNLESYPSANEFVLRGVSCGGTVDQAPVLEQVSLTIPQGELTVITGATGTGKSTLCKALIGEVSLISGSIACQSAGRGIGYCTQVPCLSNASIRDNIIGYSDVDEKWYEKVLHDTALTKDFVSLPEKDSTMVGSNGAALSTGQRQRVALARAVYSRNPILLLDDVFSGMDNETKRYIYQQLWAKDGHIATSKTTTIVTAPDRLLQRQARYLISVAGGKAEGQGIAEIDADEDTVAEQFKHEDEELSSTNQNEEEEEPGQADEELSQIYVSDLSVYKYYAKAVGWMNIILLLVLGIVFAFFYTFPGIWVKFWTANVGQRDNYYIGVYAALQAIGLSVWFLFARHCLTASVATSGGALHHQLLYVVSSATTAFLSKKDSGVLLNRFSQDMQVIDGELPAALLNTVATAFICISQIAVITTASPWLALSYPCLFLAFYAVQQFYLKTSQRLRTLDLELKSPLFTHFLDTVSALSTIRAFGWEMNHIKSNYKLLDTSQRPLYLLNMVQQWLALVLNLMVTGIAILLVSLTVSLRSSMGFTAVALLNLMMFGQMLQSVINGWTLMETSICAVSRVKEFQESTPQEKFDASTELSLSKEWPAQGRLEITNLTTSYGPDALTPSVNDVSMVIEPGQTTGICGRSGSGKSSFVLSLLHMLDIQQGKITIDSVDTSLVSPIELRRRINTIPQDAFFWVGSFRDNLDPYREASDEQILKVLGEIKLLEKVTSRGGLDAALNSESFSHGYKQLFSLARAMVRPRGSIVVMDEATSSLDYETEQFIMKKMLGHFHGATILAIAHNLNTIMEFDRVAVFDQGRLVEFGKPSDLLLKEDSAFAKLATAASK